MFLRFFTVFIFFVSFSYAFSLKEGYVKALANDPEVQIRSNSIKKIEYDMDIAKGLHYPTVDFKATANSSKRTPNSYTPNSSGTELDTDEYSIDIRQPLYDGLEGTYEQRLHKSRYISAGFYLKEAQNEMALRYVRNYINLLKAKDMLTLSTQAFQMNEDIFNKTARKVERGFGTKLEFEKAKASLEESSVNLAIDKLSFNDAIESLRNNVQERFSVNELIKPSVTYSLPHSEPEALQYALNNHPSMLVSLTNVEVSLSELNRDDKAFKPNIDLVGTYRVNDAAHREHQTNESNEYKIGIELAYNLYNGGKDIAQRKKAMQEVKEKKILIEKNTQQISNNLALAWNSYVINEEKLSKLESFLKTREIVFETTLEEFDLGTQTLTSVIDAHDDYINTKRSMISTSYDYLLAHYRVLEAVGLLSDELLNDKRTEIWGDNQLSKKITMHSLENDLKYAYNEYSLNQKYEESKQHKVLETIEQETITQPLEQTQEYEKAVEEIATLIEAENSNEEIVIEEKNLSFKERFLSAPSSNYTVNLATFSTQKRSYNFIENENLQNDAFSFIFGQDKQYYKVMYGVFETYEQATEAIKGLSQAVQANNPRVEKIEIKQALYKKYNEN
jgi:adhesin transport system outer membrane protein